MTTLNKINEGSLCREKKALLARELEGKGDLLGDNQLPKIRPAYAPSKKEMVNTK